MKFIADKNDLLEAINIAIRATPPKSPISSLEGLLFTAQDDVKITGFDMKKAIYTTIDTDVVEQGQAVINAKFVAEMVRRMPDGRISVTTDENSNATVIKCGRSEYNFVGYDVNEYPEIPKIEEFNSIVIPQKILKEMIDRTLFAVSKEDARPIYTGSLFEIENSDTDEKSLTIVSIDGYRLAKRTVVTKEGKMDPCSFVVPGFALSDVQKVCNETDELVTIAVGDKHISFTIGNTVIITRKLEGDFINYKKTIPTAFRFEIRIDREELISVINRVALVLTDKIGTPVRMVFNEGRIDCMCVTPAGKAEDTCSCVGSAGGLIVGFNDKYFTEALRAADVDDLVICMNTESTPVVIKPANDEETFTYMILPVRLHQ